MSASGIGASGPLMAQHNLSRAQGLVASSMEKLATGFRINRGSDDPAGLMTSEGLRAALATLDAESRAMERTNAVANVADGALGEVSSLLGDAHGAAVAMANTAGMSSAERAAYQMEIDSAMQSVGRIASTTTFNGMHVFDGSMTLRAGGETLNVQSIAAPAGNAEGIRAAISAVAMMRGEVGAFQANVVAPQMRSSAVAFENTAAAESLIRDTDYATEMASLMRGRVLQGAAITVAGMAGAASEGVLRMLG